MRNSRCARSRSLTFAATWRRIICRGTSSRNLLVGSASRQPTTCPVFSRGTSAAGSKGTSTISSTSIGWRAWGHSWTNWPGCVGTREAQTYCSGAVTLVSSPKMSVLFCLQLENVCCGDWTSHSGGTLRLLPFSPLTVLRPSSTGIACTVYCRVCLICKDSTSALVPRGAAPYLLQTFPSWRLTDTVTWTLWPISQAYPSRKPFNSVKSKPPSPVWGSLEWSPTAYSPPLGWTLLKYLWRPALKSIPPMASIRVCYISEGESTKAPSSKRSLCTRRHSGCWWGNYSCHGPTPCISPATWVDGRCAWSSRGSSRECCSGWRWDPLNTRTRTSQESIKA